MSPGEGGSGEDGAEAWLAAYSRSGKEKNGEKAGAVRGCCVDLWGKSVKLAKYLPFRIRGIENIFIFVSTITAPCVPLGEIIESYI